MLNTRKSIKFPIGIVDKWSLNTRISQGHSFRSEISTRNHKNHHFSNISKKKVHSNDANKRELIWHARITPFELFETTPRLINSITNWLPEDLFFADFNFNLQKSNILVTVTLQYHPKYYDFFKK